MGIAAACANDRLFGFRAIAPASAAMNSARVPLRDVGTVSILYSGHWLHWREGGAGGGGGWSSATAKVRELYNMWHGWVGKGVHYNLLGVAVHFVPDSKPRLLGVNHHAGKVQPCATHVQKRNAACSNGQALGTYGRLGTTDHKACPWACERRRLNALFPVIMYRATYRRPDPACSSPFCSPLG